MGSRAAKDALYDGLARVAKALGSGRRTEIVDLLAQGERSVEEIAREIGQSIANTSQHLQHLLRAGLVTTRREGTRVHYSLAGEEVATLGAALRVVASQHLADLDRLASDYLGDRSGLQTITRDELRQRMRDGDVVVLDVRPRQEFEAGHISGAVSIPITELELRLAEIPTTTTVAAYCRGPYCVYADDAVRLLGLRGYAAARLEDGYPEWAREEAAG
jgi:rhodanese-related sulfurtransferase/DNA-binding transcriptional ArsR family regulator